MQPALLVLTLYSSIASLHTFVVTDDSEVFCFGGNSYGQLGLGHTRNQPAPVLLQDFVGRTVERISCGAFHTLVVTGDGRSRAQEVWSFGLNDEGQLGLGHTMQCTTPQLVQVGWDAQGSKQVQVSSIACGYKHTLVAVQLAKRPMAQRLLGFGSNERGQLGMFLTHSRLAPERVPLLPEVDPANPKAIAALKAGDYWSVVVTAECALTHGKLLMFNREVEVFGDNSYGQLALGKGPPLVKESAQLHDLAGADQLTLACGARHLVAHVTEGKAQKLKAAGCNLFGQLGDDSCDKRTAFGRPVNFRLSSENPIRELQCGEHHTACLTDTGELLVFGRNQQSQLGLGKYKDAAVLEPAVLESNPALLEPESLHLGEMAFSDHTVLYRTAALKMVDGGGENDEAKTIVRSKAETALLAGVFAAKAANNLAHKFHANKKKKDLGRLLGVSEEDLNKFKPAN
jgi:X-linked retinitis pigmentosa GTPase regulator